MDLSLAIELGLAATGTAILGSMLGLGGGVFLVPIFTLFFGVDQKLAIGASAIAVAANSVVGSTVHLESRFTNLRLAMILQVTTAAGALIGAVIGVWAPETAINILFGLVLVYAALSMGRKRGGATVDTSNDPDPHQLGAEYIDPQSRTLVRYVPRNLKPGLAISSFAGALSGMLGVGGGVIQVPVMNVLMAIPMKAAAGTSSFMVGVTTVATASVYYSRGKIDPNVVVPAMIGIFVGSQFGSRLTRRLKPQRLMALFVLILLYLGGSLLLKAAGIELPGQK